MIFQGVNHVIGTRVLKGVAEYSVVRGGVDLLGLGVIDPSEIAQTRIIRAQFKGVSAALVVVTNLQFTPIALLGIVRATFHMNLLIDGGVTPVANVLDAVDHVIRPRILKGVLEDAVVGKGVQLSAIQGV
jgi:hypothetical protein